MEDCEINQNSFDYGFYSGFEALLDAKLYTDDGNSFNVHKLVLAKRSKFFQAMFCGIDKGMKEYKVSNIDGRCLREILTYIYTKRIFVTDLNVTDILAAADYFSLKDLYLMVITSVKDSTITHANPFIQALDKFDCEILEDWEIKCQSSFNYGSYSKFEALLDAKLFTDDGSSFDVHKLVLAECSKFFQAMFCRFDTGKKEYKISNIDGRCLRGILTYIYMKRIFVTDLNVTDILVAADYFFLEELYLKMKTSVKGSTITHANSFKLIQAAYLLNENEILQYCLKFIIPRFKEIQRCQKNDIADFSFETLKCILNNGSLNVENENMVWQTIVHWVQACPESRLKHVTSLLSTLAIREIDETLATEIINHDIIAHNTHTESMKNFMSVFDRKCEVIAHFLTDFKPKDFRIPQNLNVISRYYGDYSIDMDIFITYDETRDLWRKIADVKKFLPRHLIAVGFKVYVFENAPRPSCLYLNLKTMEWKFLESSLYANILSVVTIENCLYILIRENGKFNLETFDPETNKRFHIASLENLNFTYVAAIAMGKNIFVVGVHWILKNYPDIINISAMFNVVTQQWTHFSTLKNCYKDFNLVSYHNKVYLINCWNPVKARPIMEVFDPETNVWKELPDVEEPRLSINAIVSNDQLIIYDCASGRSSGEIESTAVVWNEIKECWEKLEKNSIPEDMRWYRTCTIDDTDTIKFVTKLNRGPTVKLSKSPFYV